MRLRLVTAQQRLTFPPAGWDGTSAPFPPGSKGAESGLRKQDLGPTGGSVRSGSNPQSGHLSHRGRILRALSRAAKDFAAVADDGGRAAMVSDRSSQDRVPAV